MRGLKPVWVCRVRTLQRSHLLQMRGLKLLYPYFCPGWEWSHLLQMRGLKPVRNPGNRCYVGSHLLQMRGLKPNSYRPKNKKQRRIFYRCVDWNFEVYNNLKQRFVASFTDAWIETGRYILAYYLYRVASFTDAWIETSTNCWAASKPLSHLLQMRGLKQLSFSRKQYRFRRIFYRCVDWNIGRDRLDVSEISRIFYRCVDWNRLQMPRVECGSGSHLLQMRGLKRKRNF